MVRKMFVLFAALALLVSAAAFAAPGEELNAEAAGGGIRVAIYNDSVHGHGSYFDGGDSNYYAGIKSILDSDPQGRFTTTVVTDLSASTLAAFDVLSLPDNAVPDQYLPTVAAWFTTGKVIVCFDSAVCYAAYSGLFWPTYSGATFKGTLWDYNACAYDGQIADLDYVTAGYTLGQDVSTIGGDAEFYPWMLPAGTITFLTAIYGNCGDVLTAGRNQTGSLDLVMRSRAETEQSYVYGAYRDVSGHGRMVMLGPYDQPNADFSDAWPMIRSAHLAASSYDMTFYDDAGTSQVCVNSKTGLWRWNVIKGTGMGQSFTSTGIVQATNTGFTITSKVLESQWGMRIQYYKTQHQATGFFQYPSKHISSNLTDINTLNDPPGCSGH